jgi:23S rRNA (adenine2503-C2)-methyltransferase
MEKTERSLDGTIKLNFKGYSSVIIPSINNKFSVCLSCQIGCPVGCFFCLSGKQGFKRNLTKQEILEQVEEAKKTIGKNPTSIVFMGSGEPSLNLRNVLESAEAIHSKYEIPYKKITISTIGLKNLSSLSKIKFNLAISLHSAFNEKRKEITPIACSIKKILSVSKKYVSQHRKNYIMLEYSMIRDFNDSDKDLEKLLSFDWPKQTIFNLIEFNETNKMKKVSLEKIQEFKLKILEKGYKCFIRNSRGTDIKAACGMLYF